MPTTPPSVPLNPLISMKESKHQIKLVEIEEYFSDEWDGIYYNYKFNGGEWHKELTPYKEIPWIEFIKEI